MNKNGQMPWFISTPSEFLHSVFTNRLCTKSRNLCTNIVEVILKSNSGVHFYATMPPKFNNKILYTYSILVFIINGITIPTYYMLSIFFQEIHYNLLIKFHFYIY